MLVTTFRVLSKLPLPVLHAAGGILGRLTNFATPAYRRRLRTNIGIAGFGDQHNAAIRESGKSIAELPFIWCAATERVMGKVELRNWELAQAALDAKRGVIFLTPHLGCFEVSAQAMACQTPITVLYRSPRKAALKPLIEQARARHNLRLAPANLSGVRTLLKALRQGQAIGLLPDQVPQRGEGVWADFFGRPAYTMTLPAKLHQMTGAPIILAYAERKPRGAGYVLHFSEFRHSLAGDATQQARAINQAMEELIVRCPAQYFWSYNRYKQPAGAVPAPQASTTEAAQ